MDFRGVTLPELLLCLLLFGIAVQLSLGPARHQADVLIVRGAREELVALLHRARMEARIHGHARVQLEEGGGEVLLLLPDDRSPVRVSLANRGVELELVGSRSSVELGYGALGVAQFASATIVLRRRNAETRLVISGYGRVRR